MSMGPRPAVRGMGVTPRGNGTTTGPRAAVGTSSKKVTTTAITGPRRGMTPGRGGHTPNRSQGSSSADDSTLMGLPPGVPRLNLTIEQELDILDRLESGNYIKGAGLAQFLPSQDASGVAEKPKCHQNLMGAFASLDSGPQSGKLTLPKCYNTESFSSAWSAGDTARLVVDGAVTGLAEVSLNDENDEDTAGLDKKDDYELPEHVKKLYKLMQAVDDYKRLMNSLIEAVFEARFAELFPQGSFQVIERVEKAATVLQKFMSENTSENMKLFFPSPRKDKATLPCPVEEQEGCINTFYNLSELLEKLHRYLDSQKKEVNLETMVQKFAEAVDKFEKDLKDGEEAMTSVGELFGNYRKLTRRSEGSSDESFYDLDLGSNTNQ